MYPAGTAATAAQSRAGEPPSPGTATLRMRAAPPRAQGIATAPPTAPCGMNDMSLLPAPATSSAAAASSARPPAPRTPARMAADREPGPRRPRSSRVPAAMTSTPALTKTRLADAATTAAPPRQSRSAASRSPSRRCRGMARSAARQPIRMTATDAESARAVRSTPGIAPPNPRSSDPPPETPETTDRVSPAHARTATTATTVAARRRWRSSWTIAAPSSGAATASTSRRPALSTALDQPVRVTRPSGACPTSCAQ